ncbi:hypothetical protein GW17_00043992 [Ensete ventricosum]|nr:hypothetical protein GW17_00043992 [Ensete ventricosum]
MNLKGMKQTFMGQAPRPMPSLMHIAPTTQSGAIGEASGLQKVLVSKLLSNVTPAIPAMIVPRKETLAPVVPENEATPCGEGSNKRWDKAVCVTPGESPDELYKIIDGLWAEVRKLKEEAGPVAVATTKAQTSEMTQQLGDFKSQLGEAQCQEKEAPG